MGDFLGKIAEWIEYLWPLHIVNQWERSGFYVFGRWAWDTGPGLKLKIPWFTRYIDVTVVPYIITTPRIDVTTRDGKLLSFVASGRAQVVGVNFALNEVDNYKETVQESFAATLAGKMMTLPPERFDEERLSGLAKAAVGWVNAETRAYGVEFDRIRFTTFLLDTKTFRLLTDAPQAPIDLSV